jgi:hypothetical protein
MALETGGYTELRFGHKHLIFLSIMKDHAKAEPAIDASIGCVADIATQGIELAGPHGGRILAQLDFSGLPN